MILSSSRAGVDSDPASMELRRNFGASNFAVDVVGKSFLASSEANRRGSEAYMPTLPHALDQRSGDLLMFCYVICCFALVVLFSYCLISVLFYYLLYFDVFVICFDFCCYYLLFYVIMFV